MVMMANMMSNILVEIAAADLMMMQKNPVLMYIYAECRVQKMWFTKYVKLFKCRFTVVCSSISDYNVHHYNSCSLHLV